VEPYLRLTWTDTDTGRHGWIVIDRLVEGLAGGGTRLRRGCSLEEVERLARAMSLKNGTLAIPVGGAKAGVDVDPHDPGAFPTLVRFIRAMRPIFETYMATGEDMGTSQDLLVRAFADAGLSSPLIGALNHSSDRATAMSNLEAALALADDGIPLVDCVGGLGVAEATEAALSHLGRPVQGARVAIQGFGSMGGSTARYLARKGACIVAVADVKGCVANPGGLDVEALLRGRDEHGEIDRAALRPGDQQLPAGDWLVVPADVLVPAAVADAIHVGNCELVQARLVVEAANIPTTDGAIRRLAERGVLVIPDFVANGGTNGWFWWVLLGIVEPTAESAFTHVRTVMRQAVGAVLERAHDREVPVREAAEQIAFYRLDQMANTSTA
jgi:glutamate dehydrogenase (NAD(P)+)